MLKSLMYESPDDGANSKISSFKLNLNMPRQQLFKEHIVAFMHFRLFYVLGLFDVFALFSMHCN